MSRGKIRGTTRRTEKAITTTVKHLIAVARNELGYTEKGGRNGRSGNITKYWAELAPGNQGQPWCAAFQRWVEKKAGAPLLPVQNPFYCQNLVTYAKAHSLWDTTPPYKPGDLILYDFLNKGVAHHVGLVTADDGTYVHTIEGNTQGTYGGDQSNGGGVYSKERNHGSYIMGVLRYSDLLSKTDPTAGAPDDGKGPPVVVPAPGVGEVVDYVAPPVSAKQVNPFHPPKTKLAQGAPSDDVSGKTQIHWIQWAIGVPTDGVWSDQTNRAVRVFQRYHGMWVTGVVDAPTRLKMSTITH